MYPPSLVLLLGLAASQVSAFVTTQSNSTTAKQFLVNQFNVTHYPYTVHLPDRTTRNLPPLTTPPPLLFSLSGSGARGPPSQAAELSGYDGASRKIGRYNGGNYSLAHTLAAEEFLTVVPVCPVEGPQVNASWDVTVFPGILAQVAQTYQVDLTRVYLSSYSMGARASWPLLLQNPDIFAGAIIGSGATYDSAEQLSTLFGIPIRNYYGADDEAGLEEASEDTNTTYWNALLSAESSGTIPKNSSDFLETLLVPYADHLDMTDRPWDEDIIVDGFPGALSWLITQTRIEGAQIPGINFTTYGKNITVNSGSIGGQGQLAAHDSSIKSSASVLAPAYAAILVVVAAVAIVCS